MHDWYPTPSTGANTRILSLTLPSHSEVEWPCLYLSQPLSSSQEANMKGPELFLKTVSWGPATLKPEAQPLGQESAGQESALPLAKVMLRGLQRLLPRPQEKEA